MFQFTIRDLVWLTLVVCLTFGAYRMGVEHTGEWMANEIRENGYWDDRKWMAAMFPLRAPDGKFDGRMLRVYTKPDPDGHVIETIYPDGDVVSGWLHYAKPPHPPKAKQ